jgi:CIC family chloride channel protein
MRGDVVGHAVIALLIVKSIVWAVALGSGTSGGVLAPLLMIGGSIGALFGLGIDSADPGLWAMVGMAAMMGGTMRSPLTGMIFILELTHDLNALPALLVGSVAALCVTVLLLRRSILTEKLARRGQHIAREYSVDVFELVRVNDVMDRTPPTIEATATLAALLDRIAKGDPVLSRRQATIVVDDVGQLVGMITRGGLMRALQEGSARDKSLLEAADRDVVVAYPEETLESAFGKMMRGDIGRLPVVEGPDSLRVVGYLGRAEILAARHRIHDEEERRERGRLLARPR